MNQERYHGLDLVRAGAMLLGLLLHVCIFFTPSGRYAPVSGEYQGDPLNEAFLNVIHLFRMQLFFMMAGFFAELVIDKRGMVHLFRDRVKRIVLPFIIGILVLMPVHFFIVNIGGIYDNSLDRMDPVERFTSVLFWGIPAGNKLFQGFQFDLIHFWFLYYLLILYAIHFSFRTIIGAGSLSFVTKAGCLLQFAITHKLGIVSLGLVSFPFQYSLKSVFFRPSGLAAPLNAIAFYLVFYTAGVLLYKNRHLLETICANSIFYLAISVPFCIYIMEPSHRLDGSASVVLDITSWKVTDFNLWYEGIFHNGWNKVLIVFVRAQLSWTMCFASIGLAQRYLNTATPAIRYLADSSYWVYWIHLPITFGLSKLAQQLEYLNSLTKCYIVLVITTLIVYWSYNTFIRFTVLGDYFMGRRKVRSHDPDDPFSVFSMVKQTGPRFALLGLIVYALGSLFHYNTYYQKSAILMESYVARKRATLDTINSFDGIVDQYGNTPLHVVSKRSAGKRRYNPLPILISKSSRLNERNCYGRTALFTAVRTGNLEDVILLVDAGVDLNIADKYGHTPAHVAAIKTGLRNQLASDNYYEILMLLTDKGADLSVKDYKLRSVPDCLEQFANRRF